MPVRCIICRFKFPTLKRLKTHYVSRHSKIQILKEFLKISVFKSNWVKRRKRGAKLRTFFLKDELHIRYNNDTIIIEDDSPNENPIELSFRDTTRYTLPVARSRKRKSRTRIQNHLFQIDIKKIPRVSKSLHEASGEFYECHCMEKAKPSSDTDSASDTGRTFYCIYCGNGYHNQSELSQHESSNHYFCKLCNHTECLPSRFFKVFACHLCGFEFVRKEILLRHLGYHFEQQTLENVLNMEQDYNIHTTVASGDYYGDISNILFFLTYPYEYYNKQCFRKVVCEFCYQELWAYEYERHLKVVHFLR